MPFDMPIMVALKMSSRIFSPLHFDKNWFRCLFGVRDSASKFNCYFKTENSKQSRLINICHGNQHRINILRSLRLRSEGIQQILLGHKSKPDNYHETVCLPFNHISCCRWRFWPGSVLPECCRPCICSPRVLRSSRVLRSPRVPPTHCQSMRHSSTNAWSQVQSVLVSGVLVQPMHPIQ
jgi:hypothetical protein